MDNKMKAFVRTSATNQEIELQEVQIPKMQSDEVLIKEAAFYPERMERRYADVA